MVTKLTNAHGCIEVSYIIDRVCVVFVSAILLAILREGYYKGWIYQVIMVYEQKHRCKILSCDNVLFKIPIKLWNTDNFFD